jgi:tRNA (mo5U34)-methyltransferase
MLEKFADRIRYQEFLAVRERQHRELVDLAFWQPVRELLAGLSGVAPGGVAPGATVRIGAADQICEKDARALADVVELLLPWRKGPIEIFGVEIDAEWRSDLKWDRIAPCLDPLGGKVIGDIGCNNGYYMFRMLAEKPELLLGLDPNGRYYYQFELLKKLSGVEAAHFEPLGVEHMAIFPAFFDVLLCMGVIYHRKDPVGTLQLLRDSLKPGGQLVFESMALPGDEPYCLFPEDRYGKMKNVWFVPTEGCMRVWLERTGFVDVQLVSSAQLSATEQRQTRLAPYESLSDFLDVNDNSKTVEGYPAPLRVAYSARRPA